MSKRKGLRNYFNANNLINSCEVSNISNTKKVLLRLGRENTPTASLQRVSCYDTKQSDGEVPVTLGPWRIRNTTLLPLLSGPL